MRSKIINRSSSGQLRWVILLLAVAVILPTVCLLWFMTQAVRNERLAMRQKLIDAYEKRAETFFVEYPDKFWKYIKRSLTSWKNGFSKWIWLFPEVHSDSGQRFCGFVIYDNEGNIIWPILESKGIRELYDADTFAKASQLEFEKQDISAALVEYNRVNSDSNDAAIRLYANMAMVRCLHKTGRTKEAIDICYKLAYPEIQDKGNYPFADEVLRARVLLAQLYKAVDDDRLFFHLRRVLGNSHYNDEREQPVMAFPSVPRVWAIEKLMHITKEAELTQQLDYEINKAQKIIELEQISFKVANSFQDIRFLDDWQESTIRRLNLGEPIYGVYYRLFDKIFLCLMTQEYIQKFAGTAVNDITDESVVCRLYDNLGNFIAGASEVKGKSFLSRNLGRFMPEWKADLYFRDPGVFENAASRQTAIYIWTGVLVIVLILASGGIAGQAVGKQIKLNRLKNDFITTVSHELKTPLASMRVLADTLLEGNYKDQKQATEYLHLICKENKRLSGLIDNFLTFSRMERNKQTFEIVKTSPAAIALAAADAVKTKFNKGRCEFKVEIGDDLPDVLADQDAMVTVLVNLLDNAYKYSYDKKRIELGVYSEDDSICFRVSDNGIGMSRRAVKRIFKRFYQVDRSLSREAEGCGLGLSITKFIVDAHKGSISVESNPGKGSLFIVRLPIAN